MEKKRRYELLCWLTRELVFSLVLVNFVMLVAGIIYEPLNFTIQRNSAVLNLGREVSLLDDALSCCSSKFSIIILELEETQDLENFLNTRGSPDRARRGSRVDIILSLGLIYRNKSRIAEFQISLASRNAIEKLKLSGVTTVSIAINGTLCQLSDGESDETVTKQVIDFKGYLHDNGLGLGLEINAPEQGGQCDVRRTLPILQVASVLLVRLPIISGVFVMEIFSNILQSAYFDVLKHLAATYPKASIVFTAIEKLPLEGDEKFGRYKNSKNYYNTLLAAFSYKFAESLSLGGTRVKALGHFYTSSDSGVGRVQKWVHMVQLEDSTCCKTVNSQTLVETIFTSEKEKIALVDSLIKKFKRIQVSTSAYDFWTSNAFPLLLSKIRQENLNHKNGSKESITIQVVMSIGRFYEFQDQVKQLEQDMERLINLADLYPEVVDKVIINLADYLDYEGGSYTSMVMNVSKILHPLGIRVGVRDKTTFLSFPATNNSYQADHELAKTVDVIQFKFYFSCDEDADVSALSKNLEKLSTRARERYPGKNISISVSTDSSNCDCWQFRTLSETIFNWALTYSLDIILDSSWHERVTQINATADSPSRFIIQNEVCVMVDSRNISIPINFTKSLAGVTLRLDVGRLSNISDHTQRNLYQLSMLRFSVVEIEPQDLTKLLGHLDQFALDTISPKTGIDIYINLNFNLVDSADDKSLVKLRSKARFGPIRGVHINMENHLKGTQEKLNDADRLIGKLRQGVMASLKIGAVMKFQISKQAPSKRELDLLRSIDYVVLDINLMHMYNYKFEEQYINTTLLWLNLKVRRADKSQVSTAGLFKEKLYKVFEQLRTYRSNVRKHLPNINVILRLRWPSVRWDRWYEQNSLLFWKFVNDFSMAFHFPYFVYEAFDSMETDSKKYGWFDVKNYNDLENIKSYEDKELSYLGLETIRPKLINEKDITTSLFPSLALILLQICACVSILIFVVIFLTIRVRQKNMVLSKLEARKFVDGYKSDENGVDEGGIEMTIMGRRYNPEYEISPFDFISGSISIVGRGNFGLVYKSTMERFGGQAVAVKIPKSDDANNFASTIKSLLAEIKIMSYIGEHENVLKLLGAYTKEIRKGRVYVVTEFCELGSLISYLRLLPKPPLEGIEGQALKVVDLFELNQFCMDISRGMEYLGSKRVIHGDLAARNVLLTGTKICKISDFGLSRHLEKYDLYKKEGGEPLPWRWMAIESLQRKEFTVKSDMWSYGVTIWEIFSLGEQPFPTETWNGDYCKKLEEGMRLQSPQLASSIVYNEMKTCWNLVPQERPGFSEMITFFQQLRYSPPNMQLYWNEQRRKGVAAGSRKIIAYYY